MHVISIDTRVGELRAPLLAVLATWIHGDAVSVEVLPQAKHPLQIVGASRTLVVHPARCSLLGLLLAAEALAELRHELRADRGEGRPEGIDRDFDRRVRARFDAAALRLVARFPALGTVPSAEWKRAIAEHAPRVSDGHAEVEPPRFGEATSGGASTSGAADSANLWLPDCELEGTGDALAELLDAIANGRRRPRCLEAFPELPYVVAEVRFGNRVSAPRGIDEVLAEHHHHRDAARRFAECVRQSAEGVTREFATERRLRAGIRLDQRRLADARIALRLRREIPVFVAKEDPVSVFDPDRHRSVLFSDLETSVSDGKGLAPAITLHAAIAHGFELLQITTEWRVFRQFAVPVVDGEPVVLHLELVLKAHDEPWSALVWERFLRLRRHRIEVPAAAVTFPALALDRAAGRLRSIGEEVGPEGCWHLQALLGCNFRRLQRVADWGVRSARELDEVLRGLAEQCDLRGLLWLPAALRDSLRADALARPMVLNLDRS